MKFHNTCRSPIYHSQLSTRLREIQRERKRVLEHLALLDHHIETLEKALMIMQSQDESVLALNSEIYAKHKTQHSLLKPKPRQILITFLKSHAHQAYSTHELTRLLLGFPTEKTLSKPLIGPVRQLLNDLHRKGVIGKQKVSRETTYWQWEMVSD